MFQSYMGMTDILVMLTWTININFRLKEASHLALIGQAVSEEEMFEHC